MSGKQFEEITKIANSLSDAVSLYIIHHNGSNEWLMENLVPDEFGKEFHGHELKDAGQGWMTTSIQFTSDVLTVARTVLWHQTGEEDRCLY